MNEGEVIAWCLFAAASLAGGGSPVRAASQADALLEEARKRYPIVRGEDGEDAEDADGAKDAEGGQ